MCGADDLNTCTRLIHILLSGLRTPYAWTQCMQCAHIIIKSEYAPGICKYTYVRILYQRNGAQSGPGARAQSDLT